LNLTIIESGIREFLGIISRRNQLLFLIFASGLIFTISSVFYAIDFRRHSENKPKIIIKYEQKTK